MDAVIPPRTPLAHIPTPLQRLDRLSAELGIDLWVKRDDLTGAALSGNKVRKLEFLCAAATSPDVAADTLITCGAVTSNHCRAAAVAAAHLGLRSHLVLRGTPPDVPDGNLLLAQFVGAETTFITQAQWVDRDAIMAEVADRLAREGRRSYVIPEGGSNAVGAWGYVLGAAELVEDARAADLDLRRVVHAVGSGGTTAGLALGFAGLLPEVDVVGVAVCDDGPYFDGVVGRICAGARAATPTPPGVAAQPRWQILAGYQGAGYAQTTPEEIAFYRHVARSEGMILDPVYTGKAFRALYEEARAGRIPADGTTVFLHTGGIYGLFSFAAALGSSSG